MRIKMGMIVTEASGKLGGHSFYTGGPGAFLRSRSIPSGQMTNAQSVIRDRQQQLTRSWKGLTGSQRAAWNASVDRLGRSGDFGNESRLSGFQVYVKLNSNLLLIERPLISDPVYTDVPPIVPVSSLLIDLSSQFCRGEMTDNRTSLYQWAYYSSQPHSPAQSGRRYTQKFLGIDGGSTNPFFSVDQGFWGHFTGALPGQQVIFSVRAINVLSGISSISLSLPHIITQ